MYLLFCSALSIFKDRVSPQSPHWPWTNAGVTGADQTTPKLKTVQSLLRKHTFTKFPQIRLKITQACQGSWDQKSHCSEFLWWVWKRPCPSSFAACNFVFPTFLGTWLRPPSGSKIGNPESSYVSWLCLTLLSPLGKSPSARISKDICNSTGGGARVSTWTLFLHHISRIPFGLIR